MADNSVNCTHGINCTRESNDNVSTILNSSTEVLDTGIKTGYVLCIIGSSDKDIASKVLQLVFIYAVIILIVCLFGRILHVVRFHTNLQVPGNVAILMFLLSDIAVVFYRVVVASEVLIKEKLWVPNTIAYVGAFFHQFFLFTNLFCLAVLSFEKMLYIRYVYFHIRVFSSVQRTLQYFLIGSVVLIPYTVLFVYLHSSMHYKIGGYVIAVLDFQAENLVFFTVTLFFITVIIISHWKIFRYAITVNTNGPTVVNNTDTIDRLYIKDMLKKATSIALPVVYLSAGNIVDRVCIVFDLSEEVRRCVSLLAIGMRVLDPLLFLYGNKPLRDAVFNRNTVAPLWLQDIQNEIMARRNRQNEENTENVSNEPHEVAAVSEANVASGYTETIRINSGDNETNRQNKTNVTDGENEGYIANIGITNCLKNEQK